MLSRAIGKKVNLDVYFSFLNLKVKKRNLRPLRTLKVMVMPCFISPFCYQNLMDL